MVSAGVCFGGKGRLHFVSEKVKVNADFYVNHLLPKLIEDCENLLPNNFVFQQDGAPAHSSRLAQEWIEQHSAGFVKNDVWPPISPVLTPLYYDVWGAMLVRYKAFTPKPTNKAELKTVLEAIWKDLPQAAIDLAVLAFRRRVQACILRADGGPTLNTYSNRISSIKQTALFQGQKNHKK